MKRYEDYLQLNNLSIRKAISSRQGYSSSEKSPWMFKKLEQKFLTTETREMNGSFVAQVKS